MGVREGGGQRRELRWEGGQRERVEVGVREGGRTEGES